MLLLKPLFTLCHLIFKIILFDSWVCGEKLHYPLYCTENCCEQNAYSQEMTKSSLAMLSKYLNKKTPLGKMKKKKTESNSTTRLQFWSVLTSGWKEHWHWTKTKLSRDKMPLTSLSIHVKTEVHFGLNSLDHSYACCIYPELHRGSSVLWNGGHTEDTA